MRTPQVGDVYLLKSHTGLPRATITSVDEHSRTAVVKTRTLFGVFITEYVYTFSALDICHLIHPASRQKRA